MSATATYFEETTFVAVSRPAKREAKAAHLSIVGDRAVAAELHPSVVRWAIGAYGAMMAIFWVAFSGPGDLGLSLAVITFFFAAFFGLPPLMFRDGKKFMARHGEKIAHRESAKDFQAGYFDTITGPMPAKEATVLVLLVPVALAAAAAAFAIIFAVV